MLKTKNSNEWPDHGITNRRAIEAEQSESRRRTERLMADPLVKQVVEKPSIEAQILVQEQAEKEAARANGISLDPGREITATATPAETPDPYEELRELAPPEDEQQETAA